MHAISQERFCKALLDPEALVPANLARRGGARPERRFAVHRNNVAVSLAEALAARFPSVAAIVGDTFFAGMARRFIALSPPASAILAEYGDALPEFIEGFAPASGLPYLADVARLEILWSQAYHAADAAPASPATLAALDPARLGSVGVRLHPAVRLLRSAHPVATIWAMNAGGLEPAPIAEWKGEDVLVTRPALDVRVHPLVFGRLAFLSVLREGGTLAAAIETAQLENGSFDAATAIADLVALGIATSFTQ